MTIYEFPYLIDDFKDEENDQFNYIHSNMREEQFEPFVESHKNIIGVEFVYPNDEVLKLRSFVSHPFLRKGGTNLVKVYAVLEDEKTGRVKHEPYRDIIDSLALAYQKRKSDKT